MPCTALLRKIDELHAPYLNVLEDLCNLESPTADKARVDAVGSYIACWGREHGFEVFDELVEHDWCALVVRKK